MSADRQLVAEYERVYSAAARMMWLEPRWHGRPDWSSERTVAWQALEEVLTTEAQVPAGPGDPSDPTRHLLMRRGPGDRPIPLAEAVRDWATRIREGRQIQYPGSGLLDYTDFYVDVFFEAGSCVITTSHWVQAVTQVSIDLERRLAPGRPACVIAEEAAELSVTLHEIADHFRGAFTGQGPTPHPADVSWIAAAPESFTERVDAVRLERLRGAAQMAAAHIPSRDQVIATRDYSLDMDTVKAAEILRQVLAGVEDYPWRERDPVDPAHGLIGSRDSSFVSMNARIRRELFEESPLPRVPREREVSERPGSGVAWNAVSEETTFVMAEILDEAAARLFPGRTTAMIGFDTQPFSALIAEITTYLFNR